MVQKYKYLILSLLFLTIQISITQQQQTCKNNVYFNDFINLINYLKTPQSEIYDEINKYIDREPSTQQLSLCNQTNQNSCCTPTMDTQLKNLAEQFYKMQADTRYFIDQLLDEFHRGLKTCTQQKNIPSPYPDKLFDLDLVLAQYRLSILQIIKANVKLLRGNLCAICIDPANTNGFLDLTGESPKIKVVSAKIEQYIEEVKKEYQNLHDLGPSMKKILIEYYNSIKNTENCADVLEKALNFLDNYEICSGQDCENHVKQRMGTFYIPFHEELSSITIPNLVDFPKSSTQSSPQKQNKNKNRKLSQEKTQLQDIQYEQNNNSHQFRQLSFEENYVLNGNFTTLVEGDNDNSYIYLGIDQNYSNNKNSHSDINQINLTILQLVALVIIDFLY